MDLSTKFQQKRAKTSVFDPVNNVEFFQISNFFKSTFETQKQTGLLLLACILA